MHSFLYVYKDNKTYEQTWANYGSLVWPTRSVYAAQCHTHVGPLICTVPGILVLTYL